MKIYYILKCFDYNGYEIHHMHIDIDKVREVFKTMVNNKKLWYCDTLVMLEWDMEKQMENELECVIMRR